MSEPSFKMIPGAAQPVAPFSHVVEVDGWLFLTGQMPTYPEARTALGKYLAFYNTKRPHSPLDRRTPDQAYFNALQPILVAA
jgi:Integrase core domain